METTTFEQAIEVVTSLPTDDRERFNQWFKEQELLDTKTNSEPSSEFSAQLTPMTVEERAARF